MHDGTSRKRQKVVENEKETKTTSTASFHQHGLAGDADDISVVATGGIVFDVSMSKLVDPSTSLECPLNIKATMSKLVALTNYSIDEKTKAEELLLAPSVDEGEGEVIAPISDEVTDAKMRSVLLYCASIAIKGNRVRITSGDSYHYLSKRQLRKVNILWGIPKDDENAFDGGYCFAERSRPGELKQTGTIRLSCGDCTLNYSWVQDHSDVIAVCWC
jgi:hypothetical protein